MKIQCACGAKYAFDVTPEMAQNPIRFVCANCGLDSSDYVNRLIQQQLGASPPAVAPSPAASVSPAMPRLQVARAAQPVVQTGETGAGSDAPQLCLKHRGEVCTHRCLVCQKPICPKCMELFGYLCSPLCKAKAEAKKIKVPVYAGQKTVVEEQFWRKTGKIFGAIAAVVVALLGFWFWYAWFGSVPHTIFTVHLADGAGSGQARICGKDQIVFLHGNTLARYDIRLQKEIWSHPVIDQQVINDAVNKASGDTETVGSLGKGMTLAQYVERELTWGMQLQIDGSNVWVTAPARLTHYDWNTGQVLQDVPFASGFGEWIAQDGELQTTGENKVGQPTLTYVNMADGTLRAEEIGPPVKAEVAAARNTPGETGMASTRGAAGLPLNPGEDNGKPLDPEKVAAQTQRMPYPARIALPALLSNSRHQQEIMQEAGDQPDNARSQSPSGFMENPWVAGNYSFVRSQYGGLQFTVRILLTNIVTRSAMEAPPSKSVLDSGNVNATRTADVANEILNEMQRNRGGDTVSEDESRYQVTIRRPDPADPAEWTGEVVGPAALFPLKTVTVLTAGKTVTVLDKTNKKMWEANLAYSVPGGAGILSVGDISGAEKSQYGEGPCVERGDTLYVFDLATLTAFDLATGNARWRLPSVGIAGLFFDDKGNLYVNTTTASPENIKYSRQIDINQKTDAVFLKIDPKTGKILWSSNPGNFISYLSGKFIYTYYVNNSGAGPGAGLADLAGITPTPSYIRIRRISPGDGHIMWDYQQDGAPFDVQFNANLIQLVFPNEVQVLKFVSF